MEALTILFILGFAIMLSTSIFFFCRKGEVLYGSAVTAVTSLSYLVLLSGEYLAMSGSGQEIYYTRWLFYILSCGVLMLTMSKLLKLSSEKVVPIIILNTLVMLTGAIAAVSTSPMKWPIFALGSAFFLMQAYLLFYGAKSSKVKTALMYYVFLGWSGFPVVFLLAPEGLGILENTSAQALYLTLDIVTKIIFYLHVTSFAKKEKKKK